MNSTTGRKRPSSAIPPPSPANAFSLIFAEHNDAPVLTHPPVHHARDGVDELARRHRPGEVGLFDAAGSLDLAEVTAHPHVAEVGVRPELGLDAPRSGLAVGIGLEKLRDGIRHRLLGLRTNGCQPRVVDEPEGLHLAAHTGNGVAITPGRLFLLAPIPESTAGVGAVLVEEPVDLGLDDNGPVAGAEPLLGLLHREVHGEWIHAVDAPGRHVEAERPRREPRFGGDLFDVGRHRVEVVLDEEAERQFPRRGEVETLENRPDVGGPVAEVGDGEVGRSGVLLRPGVAGGEWHSSADDGVRAESTRLEPLEVHRAAPAAAVALREAENLGEGALQDRLDVVGDESGRVEAVRCDVVDRLSEKLVVAAVRPVDAVARSEADDRTHRAALLADARMGGSVHETLAGEFQNRLLEGPDQVELPEHRGEEPGIGRLPIARGGGELGPARSRLKALFANHSSSPLIYERGAATLPAD
jgi:hypothetical protein